jgi:hypothetical protein
MYSVIGTEDAEVLYLCNEQNVSEDITGYWSTQVYCSYGDNIGIAVNNNDGGAVDVRIQYIGHSDWVTWKREIGTTFVNLKGVIRSPL